MKRILVLFLLSLPALAQYPTTPNLGLQLPPHATGPGWGIALNQNAVVLDTLFSNGACGGDGIHAVILTGNPLKFGCSTVGNPGAFVQLAPSADQNILGQNVLWNQGRTWLGINGNNNNTFGLSPNSYLFNIEQDSTSGTTYPNPSVIMGVAGGLTPIADASNLFGNSTVVRDFASAFNVDSLGAIGGSSFWFGTAGKTLAFGYGVIGASYSDGAGDVGENWGVRGLANPGSHPFTFTGTVNHNKGGTFGSGGFSGTINSDYSLFVELPATGATFTNPHEGLHIEDQTAGGILATAYGIHELGSARNDLGTGTTTVSTLAATTVNATGINGTTGVFTGLTISGISGSVQCLHVNSAGLISGIGADCGAAGGGAVSSVTGTANQIDVVNGSTTPTVSIDPTFTFPGTVTNNLSIFGSTTSAQLAGIISNETGTGSLVFGTSPTIVTPTIASFTNATHNHTNAAGGGALSLLTGAFSNQGTTTTVLHGNGAGNVSFGSVVNNDIAAGTIDLTAKVTGILPVANGGNGTNTPSLVAGTNITVTGVWPAQTISTSAGGTVTHTAGALTANAVMLGNGTADSKVLASLGTTTTLLHGNAAGAPTYSGVAIADHTATGTPSSSTFLRGDNTWATPTGTGTVTTTGSPASTQVALMSGTTSITGDPGFTYNTTSDLANIGGVISGSTPQLDPRSELFGTCKGDGTDTSTVATACWQAAEVYMQAHGGAILCAPGTSWNLDRVQFHDNDTVNGLTNQGPAKGCVINVTTDAAFVPATPTGFLQGATFRNLTFSGGSNPIDIPFGNQDVFENIQFRNFTGCGLLLLTGERHRIINIVGDELSVTGIATLCSGDTTLSIFSGSITPSVSYGYARSEINQIMALGNSPTHYAQWDWLNGVVANDAGTVTNSNMTNFTCFESCSQGIIQFGHTSSSSLVSSNLGIIDPDGVADGLAAAPFAVNIPGEIDASNIWGYDGGFSGGAANVTAEMVLGPLRGGSVSNSWFSSGVDNSTTFGLKMTCNNGVKLDGIVGGVFNTCDHGLGSTIINGDISPSNFPAGAGVVRTQLTDVQNNDMDFVLCGNTACGLNDTAFYNFYRNTGLAGAKTTDLALGPSVATFSHPIATPAATKALSTSAIGAHTCSAAQTATMTGAATTSVIKWSFASTPIGVTGYGDATTPFLVVTTFPTANTANVVVCNTSASSITPGAISVNLRLEE